MKKYLPILIFLMAFTGFICMYAGMDTFSPHASIQNYSDATMKSYEKSFAQMQLKDINGAAVVITTDQKKITIVNFWATWCLPCLEEMPTLVDLKKRYGAKLDLIGVSTDSEELLPKVRQLGSKFAINYPIVIDSKGEITNSFNVDSVPFSLVFRGNELIDIIKGNYDYTDKSFISKLGL